jgi:hypothetical protein
MSGQWLEKTSLFTASIIGRQIGRREPQAPAIKVHSDTTAFATGRYPMPFSKRIINNSLFGGGTTSQKGRPFGYHVSSDLENPWH